MAVLIRHVMNTDPATILAGASMAEAATVFSRTQTSDLVAIDEDDHVVGVLAEGDLLRAVFPRFEEVISAGGSIAEAFRIFLDNGRELASRSIGPLVIRNPITVGPDDELLTVAAVMVSEQIRCVPVVEDDRLLGSVARADVCRGALLPDSVRG
jgi:CBS domain-containing protein